MSNRRQAKATKKMNKNRPKKYSGKPIKSTKNEDIAKLLKMLTASKN